MNIGEQIKKRREALRITQQALATLLNTTQVQIARWEASDDMLFSSWESIGKALTELEDKARQGKASRPYDRK